MAISDVIQYKLDRLISLMLNDGVQPGELTDNIFLNEYKQISYRKCEDSIIGEVVISESIGNEHTDYVLRYIYTLDKRIMRIEEEKLGKIVIQWDRDIIETELINDIVDLLKIHYTEAQMEGFISSLPNDLYNKILKFIHQAA